MKFTVFLDANVFIFAFEYPNSNSNKIIELLTKDFFSAVVSEKALEEIILYFKHNHSADLAGKLRRFVLDTCHLVPRNQITGQINRLKGKIKERDLEHLATTRLLGLKYLVSYDRDYDETSEYITPKKFIELLGLESSEKEY